MPEIEINEGTGSVQGNLLRESIKKIEGDRNKDYGAPHVDFERTAGMLNSLGYRGPGGRELEGSDWALILICGKLSRLIESPNHNDSVQDIGGYAGCYWEARDWAMKQAAERVEETKKIFGVGNPDHERYKRPEGAADNPPDNCTRLHSVTCPGGSCGEYCQMTGYLKVHGGSLKRTV